MGTTCTAVAVRGTELYIAHVGDSRAYLVRERRVRQLTSDHSLVAQLVASGQMSRESARTDPRRNVVTRSVGAAQTVEVDSIRFDERLRPGDTVLVCSDGLHGQVTEEEIARLASNESLERGCQELIALANQRGGPDNITVAMARPDVRETARTRPAARPAARSAEPARAKPAATKRTLQWLIAFGMMRAERQQQATSWNAADGASEGSGRWR
jgi:protein phosphatase